MSDAVLQAGTRPARSFAWPRAERLRKGLLCAYAGLFFLFLYAPIGLLLVLSVNDSEVIGLPFKGTTSRWYAYVLTTPELIRALANSFALGFVSAGIATAIALMMAMGFRREFPLKGLLMKIVLLPILIPGIVGSAVFLVFFGYLEIPFGLWTTALMVHITWALPFAFLTIFPRLHGFDRGLEEAAMDLGATPIVVFRRILLPIIRPGIVATFLFAFTLSFDEFVRTFLVIGTQRTIPVHLWTLIIDQMAPFLPAVGVVIMAVSVSVSLIGFALTPKEK
ncbi:ABC transporter permease [Bosea sp. (in: a-proteobacteria)]|uniref:ABC transporter permease n=1 Tax=Bosea sp. (in: a-proteobacteria) TaxID=1871050 RepID=UPI00333F3BC4